MPKPVHEIRIGLIKATVRRTKTQSGLRHTVSIVRLYRNGDVWKESTRFGRDDIPAVRLALDKAYVWIYEHGNQMQGAQQQASSTKSEGVRPKPAGPSSVAQTNLP